METIDQIDSNPIFHEPAEVLGSLSMLTETRHLLLKRGKILGHRIHRYFVFHQECLVYYTSRNSIRIKGSVDLRKAIAIPISSIITGYCGSIKVITMDLRSEFYLFAKTNFELSQMMLYLKLASNEQIKTILDLYCSKAEDEFKPLKEANSYKSNQIEPVILNTPKKVIPLLSPTSEGDFDAPEENVAFAIPNSKFAVFSHNLSMNGDLSMIKEDNEDSMMKTTEKLAEFKPPKRRYNTKYELPEIQNSETIREAGLRYL